MIDESGNQLRHPKPMSDLSFMANRNRTQNRTPDGGNRISSGGRSSDPFRFGKGAGNPNYDEDGNVVRHSMTLTLDPSEVTLHYDMDVDIYLHYYRCEC